MLFINEVECKPTGRNIIGGEVYFSPVVQNTDEWMQLRIGRITASSFAKIFMGKNTKGYKEFITQKALERILGERQDEEINGGWLERGHDLEPQAREEYELLTFTEVQSDGFYFNNWVGVSPDGMTADGMIEIKCPKHTNHLKSLIERKVPAQYIHQVGSQMYITGANYCDYVSFHPDYNTLIKREVRNPAYEKELEENLRAAIIDIQSEVEKLKNLV